jgi:hypothetical protein
MQDGRGSHAILAVEPESPAHAWPIAVPISHSHVSASDGGLPFPVISEGSTAPTLDFETLVIDDDGREIEARDR